MILKGDCIEVMKAMKPNSVDAIVTDPPYGLEFMGKEWDKLWDSRNKDDQDNEGIKTFLRAGKNLSQYKAGIEMQLWHTQWLTEAFRVLKPGGSMLVMGGTRTSHRLACAIEDSGFIIKDTLMWLYGSGFPKAQDLGKMIDKRAGKERKVTGITNRCIGKSQGKGYKGTKTFQELNWKNSNKLTIPSTDLAKHWDGFKVGGIKPAYEPIIWAVKPPEGSYVDNVLKWGVGAVNVDECRVEAPEGLTKGGCTKYGGMFGNDSKVNNPNGNSKGRFPANVILSHHPECVQVGMKRVRATGGGNRKINYPTGTGASFIRGQANKGYGQVETVESWDCHPDCAVRLLDEQSEGQRAGKPRGGKTVHSTFKNAMFNMKGEQVLNGEHLNDNGGASRFFYCAKASRGERNAGLEGMEEKSKPVHIRQSSGRQKAGEMESLPTKNNHPTVKPIKLFEYLIKLVTREGQVILDPFIGSGTTAIAAHNTGRKCVGIEKEDEYLTIAKRRIDHWKNQPKQMEIRI